MYDRGLQRIHLGRDECFDVRSLRGECYAVYSERVPK